MGTYYVKGGIIMREKIYRIVQKIYGSLMFVSFFGGFLPVVPFIAAIIVGGTFGEKVSVFLYKQYYPWIIALSTAGIVIGLIGMYIGKISGLSVKNVSAKKNDSEERQEK